MLEALNGSSFLSSDIKSDPVSSPPRHTFLQLANNFDMCRRASCVSSEVARMMCQVSRKVVVGKSILGKVNSNSFFVQGVSLDILILGVN